MLAACLLPARLGHLMAGCMLRAIRSSLGLFLLLFDRCWFVFGALRAVPVSLFLANAVRLLMVARSIHVPRFALGLLVRGRCELHGGIPFWVARLIFSRYTALIRRTSMPCIPTNSVAGHIRSLGTTAAAQRPVVLPPFLGCTRLHCGRLRWTPGPNLLRCASIGNLGTYGAFWLQRHRSSVGRAAVL